MSDAEQTAADSDQTSADKDQMAADCDQAASDRDVESGVDSHTHDITERIRQRTTRERAQTSGARLDAADLRDATANTADITASARDIAAEARDLAMTKRDDLADERDLGTDGTGEVNLVLRAAGDRKLAAEHRVEAAEQRALAARDRRGAEADRKQAGRERKQAFADREELAGQLALAANDPLTGARERSVGLIDLAREVDRAGRTGTSLVAAYVDVVGLKTLNDTAGHKAGDELLKNVVQLFREHLRSYDLIIRLGGDEFLCVMSKMNLPGARMRFETISDALTTATYATRIRTGFASLAPGETSTELIARADGEMIDGDD